MQPVTIPGLKGSPQEVVQWAVLGVLAPRSCSTSGRWPAGRWGRTGTTAPAANGDEFAELFENVLERSYVTTIERYAGEPIV